MNPAGESLKLFAIGSFGPYMHLVVTRRNIM
jgi:hypothetical protein